MTYNSVTGEISITESGVYYINWWVAADGSPIAIYISLALRSSAGDNILGSTPILSGVVTGNALLQITANPGDPVTLKLVNVTGNEMFIAPTPIQADLTIIKAGN